MINIKENNTVVNNKIIRYLFFINLSYNNLTNVMSIYYNYLMN